MSAARILTCLALVFSLAFATLPMRMSAFPAAGQIDCCTKMKAPSGSQDCEKHSPKSDPEKRACCAACAFGLAFLASNAAPFVYPPGGDETFAAYISSGRFLSHRPPVPPPRA